MEDFIVRSLRRFIVFLFAISSFLSISQDAFAKSRLAHIEINGVNVCVHMVMTDSILYPQVYFPVTAVYDLMEFPFSYNTDGREFIIEAEGKRIQLEPDSSIMLVDGVESDLRNPVLMDGGNLLAPSWFLLNALKLSYYSSMSGHNDSVYPNIHYGKYYYSLPVHLNSNNADIAFFNASNARIRYRGVPQLSNMADKSLEEIVNAEFIAYAALSQFPDNISLHTTIVGDFENLLSISLYESSVAEFSSNRIARKGFNIDLKYGKLLTINDIFIDGDYELKLAEGIYNTRHRTWEKNIEQYYYNVEPEKPEAFSALPENLRFNIKEGALIIYYEEEAIEIPIENLHGLLKDEYINLGKNYNADPDIGGIKVDR